MNLQRVDKIKGGSGGQCGNWLVGLTTTPDRSARGDRCLVRSTPQNEDRQGQRRSVEHQHGNSPRGLRKQRLRAGHCSPRAATSTEHQALVGGGYLPACMLSIAVRQHQAGPVSAGARLGISGPCRGRPDTAASPHVPSALSVTAKAIGSNQMAGPETDRGNKESSRCEHGQSRLGFKTTRATPFAPIYRCHRAINSTVSRSVDGLARHGQSSVV